MTCFGETVHRALVVLLLQLAAVCRRCDNYTSERLKYLFVRYKDAEHLLMYISSEQYNLIWAMAKNGYTPDHFLTKKGYILKPSLEGTSQVTRLVEVGCQHFLAKDVAVTPRYG